MQQEYFHCLYGNGTKISKYLINHDKIYAAEIKLGIKTDTADREGNIIEEKEVSEDELNEERVKSVLKSFIGKQEQIPPMYSAIKVNGKKLYEYARRGEQVEVKPRKIEIYDLKLDKIDLKGNIIKITASVSKGTYIRTLCENIAEKLGTVGYMNKLNRIKVGEFEIESAKTIDELENNKDNIKEYLITIEELFKDKEKIILDNKTIKGFLNGIKIDCNLNNGICRVYNNDNIFIGIANVYEKKAKRDVIIENS